MSELGWLDSFVQVAFAVNTLFSAYRKISWTISSFLDKSVALTATHAVGLAVTLADSQEARNTVEAQVRTIGVRNERNKKAHQRLAFGFRALSLAMAVYCVIILNTQVVHTIFTGQGSWLLVCPLPLYLFFAMLLALYQIFGWWREFVRLRQIARPSRTPEFRLPPLPPPTAHGGNSA